jgi:hypothetical protein
VAVCWGFLPDGGINHASNSMALTVARTAWGFGNNNNNVLGRAKIDSTRPYPILFRAAQTVSSGNAVAKIGAAATLPSTATSGLPVSYAAAGPVVITASKIAMTESGAIQLIAWQAGDAFWKETQPVVVPVAVVADLLRMATPPPPVFNPSGNFYEQSLDLTNYGVDATGGFQVRIGGVPSGITVEGGTYDAGTGSWTVNYSPVLAAGQNGAVTVRYNASSGTALNPVVAVVPPIEFVPAADPNFANAMGGVDFNAENGAVVPFRAVPGRSYQVQYSPDLQSWTSVVTPVLSRNTRIEWVDDGSVTGTAPGSAAKRFYRVKDVTP